MSICGQCTLPAAAPAHTQNVLRQECSQECLTHKWKTSAELLQAFAYAEHKGASCGWIPSVDSAAVEGGCLALEVPAALALQGLNSALSFMRSYSLILARALSK